MLNRLSIARGDTSCSVKHFRGQAWPQVEFSEPKASSKRRHSVRLTRESHRQHTGVDETDIYIYIVQTLQNHSKCKGLHCVGPRPLHLHTTLHTIHSDSSNAVVRLGTRVAGRRDRGGPFYTMKCGLCALCPKHTAQAAWTDHRHNNSKARWTSARTRMF